MSGESDMSTFQIPAEFNRSASSLRDAKAAEESALFLIRHACESLGLVDLADCEVLDVGCGTKFTHAFLNHDIPVKRYVGVDVYREMIDFLRANVTDPRFEYHHVNVRNELYNPDAASPRISASAIERLTSFGSSQSSRISIPRTTA
jgi:SAM-dependent methyltransferase